MTSEISTFAIIILIISMISWMYVREIIRSRRRTRTTEKRLTGERDRLEMRVSERTKELVESERARSIEREHVMRLGELSRGLFHDLMSPLTAISLSLEKLASSQSHVHGASSESSAEETRELVRKAVSASKRMNQFMDSVRSVIGGDISVQDGARETADITEQIGIAMDVLAYTARMSGASIRIGRIDPIRLNIHPVRLQQLFMNMLTNSLEAGATDVEVSATIEGNNREEVMIMVRDNGSGISREHQKIAFKKPFTTKPKGNGLGLTTIRAIVEDELGGSVSIETANADDERKRRTTCSALIPILM